MQNHLNSLGINSAWDLAQADTALLRQRFSVLIENTIRELRGLACVGLEDEALARMEICCSRSFGTRLKTLEPIQEGVTAYATRGSLCRQIRVSLRTGMFNPNEAKYANGLISQLPYPTDDTRLLIRAALRGIEQLYREGFSYAKAEVLLLDLCKKDEYTPDLFSTEQPIKSEHLMATLDAVNGRWGRGTLQPARLAKPAGWAMRQQLLSPCYTTRWQELWAVKARQQRNAASPNECFRPVAAIECPQRQWRFNEV